jgi:uncharacterized protein (DUF1015 family)
MPRLVPFRGLRYRAGALVERGASLDEVIAPPYDVIEPDERRRLAARSPYNSVRVELPVKDDGVADDPYQGAAALLAEWQSSGILALDHAPALYGYRMSFTDDEGRSRRLTGVIGALGLEPVGQGDVLPHERTLAKPLGDRFELLRACRVNTSPVWALSAARGLSELVSDPGPDRRPGAASATDGDGVVHQLWPVADRAAVEAVAAAVASGPLVIADGHHRYETALAYQAETEGAPDRPPGAGAIMALVAELADDQLWVRPIHRLVEGLPRSFDVVSALRAFFSVEKVAGRLPSPIPPRAPLSAPLLVAPEGTFALHQRPEGPPPELDADSSRLEPALDALPAHQVSYLSSPGEVVEAVGAGRASAGFLLRPVTVGQIAEAARARRRFPPKTSLFSPKPRTGMVFRPLDA